MSHGTIVDTLNCVDVGTFGVVLVGQLNVCNLWFDIYHWVLQIYIYLKEREKRKAYGNIIQMICECAGTYPNGIHQARGGEWVTYGPMSVILLLQM